MVIVFKDDFHPFFVATHIIYYRIKSLDKKTFKAMPHGSVFYNKFAKIHQIYEKFLSGDGVFNEIVIARHAQLNRHSL